MARKIKLRVWDIQYNKMIEGQFLYNFNTEIYPNFPSHYVITQWTGLYDKDGIEIYEDDIVRILYTDWCSQSPTDTRTLEEYNKEISMTGVVVWEKDRYVIEFYQKLGNDLQPYTDRITPGVHGQIHVIGNIYENSNLIKRNEKI